MQIFPWREAPAWAPVCMNLTRAREPYQGPFWPQISVSTPETPHPKGMGAQAPLKISYLASMQLSVFECCKNVNQGRLI